jgi:hypothetical protein
MKKAKRMLTPKEYSVANGVPYQTVMGWLRRDLIEGARKEAAPPPFTGHIYKIPENAPVPVVKPGPKPKKKP